MSDDTIVIPDVHGRKFWREAVEMFSENDTIFLGDYLDPYPDEGISSEEAIANLEEIIAYTKTRPNVTLLMGNHDLHYLCNFGEDCRLDYANSAKIHFLYIDAEGEDSKGTMLFVTSEDITMDHLISQEELDLHRSYVNYDCLDLSHCGDYLMNSTGSGFGVDNLDLIEKFLTDYILYFDTLKKYTAEDIVATLDFDFNSEDGHEHEIEFAFGKVYPSEEAIKAVLNYYIKSCE